MSIYVVKKATANGAVFHLRHKLGRDGQVTVLGTYPNAKAADKGKRRARDLFAEHGHVTRTMMEAGRSERLRDVAERWHAGLHTTEATRMMHRQVIEHHLGDLADRPVATIQPADVKAWVDEQAARYAAGTVKNRLNTVRMVLDAAGLKPNPGRDPMVKRPQVVRGVKALPSLAELRTLRGLLDPQPAQLMDLLLYGGLRWVEASDLTWRNVDPVERALVGVRGKGRGGRTRVRTVAVLPGQPDWLPVQPADASADARLFPDVSREGFRSQLNRNVAAAGLPHVHPHLLRHWHGTWLSRGIARGVHGLDHVSCAERLGHSVSMFLETYGSHPAPPGMF